MTDEENENRWDRAKKKMQEKAEKFALSSILRALKALLPDDAANLIDEFNDPEVFEPYLRDAFLMMFKSMDIPPDEIRFVIAFNGKAERMIYAVQVKNIHEGVFKQVEFPMSMFLSNVLNIDKRTATISTVKQSILAMRFYKKNTDGSIGGKLILPSGETLQLNM